MLRRSRRCTIRSMKPCSQQEFAGLKAAGELDADGLLDDARAGEADQGLGLGQDEVAQRGEAGRDAPHRRVGEHAEVEAAGGVISPQGGRHLRHLHQGENPLVHPGPAARSGDDHQRQLLAGRLFDRPGQLLADDRAHAPHDETAVGDAEDDADALDESLADDGRLLQAGALLLGLDPLRVGAAVVEAERIERLQVGDTIPRTCPRRGAGRSARAAETRKVVVALRADAAGSARLACERGSPGIRRSASRRLPARASARSAHARRSVACTVLALPWHRFLARPPFRPRSCERLPRAVGRPISHASAPGSAKPFRCRRSTGAISIHSKPPQDQLLVELDARLAFQVAGDHAWPAARPRPGRSPRPDGAGATAGTPP